MKHQMQFNDGGADWCINCGMFDIYCDPDEECEALPTARFDLVTEPMNLLRTHCDLFGEEGLTPAGKLALAESRANIDASAAS